MSTLGFFVTLAGAGCIWVGYKTQRPAAVVTGTVLTGLGGAAWS